MQDKTIVDLYQKRTDFFFAGKSLYYVLLLFIFLASFTGFLLVSPEDPKRAWAAFLINNLFFYLLSLGGIVFGCIQDACKATWARAIKRLHEVFGLYFFVSSLLFIFFIFAVKFNIWQASSIYQWITDPHMLDDFPGKNEYLTPEFFFYRVLFVLISLMILMLWVIRQNTLADRAFMQGRLSLASNLSWLAAARLRFWSSPVLFATGILFTFLMTDLTMSLAPLWFSTLWAGWFFSVLMQLFLASIIIFLFILKKHPIGSFISRDHFHDLGKFLLGFTCFFAYLTYAHILTYWYGNIPEETEYFLHRLHSPWQQLMIFVAIFAFVVPFLVLVAKPTKWTGYITIPLCIMILVSQWIVHLIVVLPQLVFYDDHDHADKFSLASELLPEVFAFIAFLSSFIFVIYLFGKYRPMVSLHDPLLLEHLNNSH